MKYTVSEQVKQATTKCDHNFSCLETGKCGKNPMCTVLATNGANVLHLAADDTPRCCAYRLQFGNGSLCVCPTHYAIKTRC